ncbi:MAG TPA: mechanosensitive ion channel domain-containing protein [Acidimicrobiales bacterium]|nr:mechanosensitive ion channel domain-containing protein [Acidimicrobiales bacterium]
MPAAPLTPPPPGGPWPATLAASGGGWLFDLLTKAGVSRSTASTVVEFVLRPLEVVVVVVIAALLAHLGARAIRRWLGSLGRRAASRAGSERATARAATVTALVANLWRFVVLVVLIAIVLGMLGVNLTPLLASATVIGATIGFGAQALVRDYLSGILLTLEDQFGIGDTITVDQASGVVEDLSLRVTRVRAWDGTVWYVPNGEIRRLANTSRGWARAVVDLPVTVGGATTVDAVKAIAAEAAGEVAGRPAFAPVVREPPEVSGVVAAGATSCTVRVSLRTTPAAREPLERSLREAVIQRLVAAGAWPAPG